MLSGSFAVAGPAVLADSSGVLGGSQLIVWIVLALGGAMLVGNGMALIRPRTRTKEGELEKAPFGRSAMMAGIGAVAALWALASLLH